MGLLTWVYIERVVSVATKHFVFKVSDSANDLLAVTAKMRRTQKVAELTTEGKQSNSNEDVVPVEYDEGSLHGTILRNTSAVYHNIAESLLDVAGTSSISPHPRSRQIQIV